MLIPAEKWRKKMKHVKARKTNQRVRYLLALENVALSQLPWAKSTVVIEKREFKCVSLAILNSSLTSKSEGARLAKKP